jgi:hypothetical protein
MRHSSPIQGREPSRSQLSLRRILCVAGLLCSTYAYGQAATNDSLAKQVQQLTESVAKTQSQLEQSQRELEQMRSQLAALQQQMAQQGVSPTPSSAAELSAAVDEIREQQALQQAQIATHEQSKVESESKYAVKLSGLVLLTGFVNTTQVDLPATPTVVMPGSGNTGATIRQTILGLDARGPHLMNASSHADVRVDFDGDASPSAYTGGLLRLRTAHASLQWEKTEAFFSLDHPLISPNTPSSLTAVAVPALAWSGNLWTWNPEVGLTRDFSVSAAERLRLQLALIDIANPPALYSSNSAPTGSYLAIPTTAENSRWPGVEGRIALVGLKTEQGLQIGVGGVFAPHRTTGGRKFNTWAGTVDYRLPLAKCLELSGSFYHGQALGGLGGGDFKDYVYRVDPDYPNIVYSRALDNTGGWAQLKARGGEHLEFNLAFGSDQVDAEQLRPYSGDPTNTYLNLARNGTFTGNVIYSPSAYLLFSLEYRHLESSPVIGPTIRGDIIGIATGYRF